MLYACIVSIKGTVRSLGYGTIPRWVGFVGFGIASYVAPRVALSSAKRASGHRSHFRPMHLSRAHATAPSGAPVYVADCGSDQGSDPHHAAPRNGEGGARVCAKARRLDRGALGAPAGSGALCSRGHGAIARRPPSHHTPPRRARDGLDRDRFRGSTASLRG